MADALGYVDPAYLESTARLLRALKDDSYDWKQAQRGNRVLDLGCGPARTRSRWRSGSVAMGYWSG